MKPFLRAVLVCLMPLSLLHAQEAAAPQKEKPKRPFEIAFSNLPEAKRNDFIGKINESARLFNEKRVFEALDKGNEAMSIFPENPDLLNLLGACQVEFRNFDKAMEYFKKADALNPNDPRIFFNIAELNFVTKNWEEAELNLTKGLKLLPSDSRGEDLQLSRLIEFKLLLTKLKLNKGAEAASMVKKYNYLDDSPFPYYAEAAIHFSEGREIEAEAAMARGNRIFQDPSVVAAWQDSMIEYGFIKGFFGGDPEVAK